MSILSARRKLAWSLSLIKVPAKILKEKLSSKITDKTRSDSNSDRVPSPGLPGHPLEKNLDLNLSALLNKRAL